MSGGKMNGGYIILAFVLGAIFMMLLKQLQNNLHTLSSVMYANELTEDEAELLLDFLKEITKGDEE